MGKIMLRNECRRRIKTNMMGDQKNINKNMETQNKDDGRPKKYK